MKTRCHGAAAELRLISAAGREHGTVGRPGRVGVLRAKRSHVDREAVFHVGLGDAIVGIVDLLDRDDFDVCGDVVFATEVEHFLGFGKTTDGGTGEATATEDKSENVDRQRLIGSADHRDVAIAGQQVDVGVDIVIGSNAVEDEIEAAGVFSHFVGVLRDDDVVGTESQRVFFLLGEVEKTTTWAPRA